MRYKETFTAMKMKKHGISEDVIAKFAEIMPNVDSWPNAPSNTDRAKTIAANKKFYQLMDKYLNEEQRLILFEYGGTCRGGETGRQAKVLQSELAGMSIAEKIEKMNENPHIHSTRLNEDGTITAICGCHCLQARNNADVWHTSALPLHYGCSAGAALASLKKALNVKARIKSIDYPKSGDSKTLMEFTFEIIE